MASEHFDVLIVGAGLSGIGAACHLKRRCPRKSFAILEGRAALGGTWDLFRYPGVRSDSDMYTLGYSFRPWTQARAIADGAAILDYLRHTASEHGVDRHIRYHHRVRRAAWSSRDVRWTVEAERAPGGEVVQLTCGFLFVCTGYYDYAHGYMPSFPNIERFAGRVVHPQQWPPDIDYAGKRVVVIGSGATAITLVPALAKTAAHVTLLQRSPTYVISQPAEDRVANALRRILPARMAYLLARWKNVLVSMAFFRLSRRHPARARQMILGHVRKALGPDYDVAAHFTPRYNPWDQRLCVAPDGDLFKAIRRGRVAIVTDRIETFTPGAIQLGSSARLETDLIVTATGLELQLFGGMQVSVDGKAVDPAQTLNYKGVMFSDVPNLASSFGYTNASWTLKCDLTCEYVCRLLNYMDERGYRLCVPRNADPSVTVQPLIDFSSGYVQRALHRLPRQGSKIPWKLHQSYALDILMLRYGRIDDAVMQFAGR